MTRRFVVAGMLAVALPAVARAQSAECGTQPTQVQDACQKGLDLFNFMAPQLGTSIAGGNAIQGSGGTLGGLGHFSVGLRANAVGGALPQVDRMSVSLAGPQASDIPTTTQIVGLPAVDAAVGVFGGLPLGITKVGGVDLLVNAAYLPEFSSNGVSLTTPSGSMKFGLGARVGLLQESLIVPGVSVSYLRRDLPTVGITAAYQGNGNAKDTLQLNSLALKTDAWRVVASKNLLMFGLAVGAGQDRYESRGDLRAVVNNPVLGVDVPYTTAPFKFAQDVTRTNYFASASMNMLMVKFVGEIGRVSGGDIPTYNSFGDKRADDSLVYGSVGVRFGF